MVRAQSVKRVCVMILVVSKPVGKLVMWKFESKILWNFWGMCLAAEVKDQFTVGGVLPCKKPV